MKKILFVLLAALVALPTMAQKFKEQDPQKVQFQSTSAMAPVNSQYSAQPMLNEDGTAYNPAASAAPSRPRRTESNPGTPPSEGDELPVGDAVLPLMLMALAFCGVIYLRRRKALSR